MDDDVTGPRPHRAFGAALQRIRKERGLTQQRLAQHLGTATSWVSQVESGHFFPSPERLGGLVEVLGTEVMAAATATEQQTSAATAITGYWAGRVRVLEGLANAERDRDRRQRFKRLARRLASVASRSPEAQQFVRGDRLVELSDISAALPRSARLLILLELATHDPVSPHHVSFRRREVHDQLDLLIEDELLLQPADFDALTEVLEHPAREWPSARELEPVGGTYGALVALSSGDPDALLLKGRDPIGWLGWSYAGGLWLARPITDDIEVSATEGPDARRARTVAQAGAIAGLSGAAVSTGLGVVGTGLGVATRALSVPHIGIGWMAARRMLTPELRSEVEPGRLDSAAAATVTYSSALALGQHWVRMEMNKLVALYESYPEVRDGDPGLASVPTVSDALRALEGVHEFLDTGRREEARLSDMRGDLDRHPRARLFQDLQDTVGHGLERISRLVSR